MIRNWILGVMLFGALDTFFLTGGFTASRSFHFSIYFLLSFIASSRFSFCFCYTMIPERSPLGMGLWQNMVFFILFPVVVSLDNTCQLDRTGFFSME